MINHAVRCATVTNLLERAGLATKEVVQIQLKPYRIKRDNDDLNKVSYSNDKLHKYINYLDIDMITLVCLL